jgi:hypothetical protein
MFCGIKEDDDRPKSYDAYHRAATEPTAPPYATMTMNDHAHGQGGVPYMHTYMENSYPLDDVPYKMSYDSEMEPLNTEIRHSRI